MTPVARVANATVTPHHLAQAPLRLLEEARPARELPQAALTTEPARGVSTRYGLIHTAEAVAELERQGFAITRTREGRSRTARHAVFLRHRDFVGDPLAQYVPEAVVLNAHDGSMAFRLAVGLYLPASGRTLFVGAEWAALRVRHTKQQALELSGALPELLAGAARLGEAVGIMRAVAPTAAERQGLAREALKARFGNKPRVAPDELLSGIPDSASVFELMVALQERLLGGGLRTLARGRTRAVKALRTEVEFSQKLFAAAWALAESA